MSKMKKALILEGGGLRGAYTAGVLTWLINEGIEFDGSYGISTGALHLTSFLLKDKDFLYNCSTKYLTDKKAIGFSSVINNGHIVSYDYLMNNFKEKGLDITKLKDYPNIAKVGLYDLNASKTLYCNIQEMNMDMLKAACSLPILGKITKIGNHEYLDGGITKMIPIEEAINDKMDKYFVIATKPLDYVRKPANIFVRLLMKIFYHKCPQIEKDYKVRHINYQKQISLIKEYVNNKDAIYMCPSKKTKVTRIGGSEEELIDLFNLGISDMENKREEILNFFNS